MNPVDTPIAPTSLAARLEDAVRPDEVVGALSDWLRDEGHPRLLGLYLAARDGAHHLDHSAACDPVAPDRLYLRSGGTEPGTVGVAFDFRDRPLGAVLLAGDTPPEGLREELERHLAPSLFRALYLEDAVTENERTRQQLFYLDEMGKLIGQLDLDLLLVNILELTSAHLGADIGSLTLLRGEGMETVVDWGLPHEAITELTLRDGTPALQRAIDSRRPVLLEREDLAPTTDDAYNFDHILLLPLCTSEAVWGSINLVAPALVDDLDSPQLVSIRSGVGLAATAVENALLFEIKLAREREQEQLEIGQQIQSALLPDEAPSIDGLDVFGSSVSATMIGGDYYDYFELPDGRIGLAVADVAGKGVPAGLIMTATRALFRAAAARHCDPPAILEEVNTLLCAEGFGSRFVTAIFAAIDVEAGTVTYASAGHDPPLIHRAASGEIEDHPLPALPLGLRPNARYAKLQLDLRPGDVMVLYTDGVTEAMDAGREQFGERRLAEVLKSTDVNASAHGIRDAILAAVEAHCAGSPRHDDTTLIVVRRTRSDSGGNR